MGVDPSAKQTPLIPLRRVTDCKPTRSIKNIPECQEWTLSTDPRSCWSEWQKEVLDFQCDWRISTKEIVLEAQIWSLVGPQDVHILIDTGARIPIAFRSGLIEDKLLHKAQFPVKFSVADGQPMSGGTHGTFLGIKLPIKQNNKEVLVRTAPLFAYEASIVGMDLIIGYPFLKAFGISIDTSQDCLTLDLNSMHAEEGKVSGLSVKHLGLKREDPCPSAPGEATQSLSPVSEAIPCLSSRDQGDVKTDLSPCTGEANICLSRVNTIFSPEFECLFCGRHDGKNECCAADRRHHKKRVTFSPNIGWDDAQDVLIHPDRLQNSDWDEMPLRTLQGREPLTIDQRKIFQTGEFITTPTFFHLALEFADLTPTVDAFASKQN